MFIVSSRSHDRVVAGMHDLAGGAAEELDLLGGLHLVGAGRQSARADAGVDERL